MNRRLVALISLAAIFIIVLVLLKNGPAGTVFVWNISRGGTWLLPLVIVSSVIDSINPCAFSILLLTIAFLFSLNRTRADILKIGAVYIFGIFVIYLLIGIGLIQAMHLFGTPHFMAKVGAYLLMAMGLIGLINEFFPAFPIKLQIPASTHTGMAVLMKKASLPAAFLLGAVVGICEFPCTGGPYLMILGLLHDKATYMAGTAYLFLYNVIFVFPLVLILLLSSDKTVLNKIQTWRKLNVRPMRLYGSLAMIILGLIILSI
ncbi:MAG: cytochrome c biogenesis protein CcdA [Patescibacteria group bacterium]